MNFYYIVIKLLLKILNCFYFGPHQINDVSEGIAHLRITYVNVVNFHLQVKVFGNRFWRFFSLLPSLFFIPITFALCGTIFICSKMEIFVAKFCSTIPRDNHEDNWEPFINKFRPGMGSLSTIVKESVAWEQDICR